MKFVASMFSHFVPGRGGALVIRLSLTALAVGWLLRSIELEACWRALVGVPRWLLVVPFVLLLVNATLHGLRLVVLLRGLQISARWRDAVSAILQGQFAGLVLPRGGGDVVKVAWLGRATGRTEAVLAVVAAARLLELIPWLALLLYGLGWGLQHRYPLLGTSAGFFALAFAAVLVCAAAVVRRGDGLANRIPIVGSFLSRAARSLRDLTAAPLELGIAAVLVLPTAAINIASVWIILRGFGVPMPLSEAVAVVPAADTVISLPVTVAGVGLREGVFVRVLGQWGIGQADAVAIALVRWSGEVGRAAVGGVLFVASGRLGVASRRRIQADAEKGDE